MRADFISARKEIKPQLSDLLFTRFKIKYAVADFMINKTNFELFKVDFMSFRVMIKFLWIFVGEILGGVAEN